MKLLILIFISQIAIAGIGWKGNSLTLGGVSYEDQSVEVVADDTVLSVGMTTLFKLSSDNAVGNQRDILLEKPAKNNHMLILKFEDEASDKINLVDGSAVSGGTGVVKLAGLWNPNAGDTLTLIYSDPDYLELGRSNN